MFTRPTRSNATPDWSAPPMGETGAGNYSRKTSTLEQTRLELVVSERAHHCPSHTQRTVTSILQGPRDVGRWFRVARTSCSSGYISSRCSGSGIYIGTATMYALYVAAAPLPLRARGVEGPSSFTSCAKATFCCARACMALQLPLTATRYAVGIRLGRLERNDLVVVLTRQ